MIAIMFVLIMHERLRDVCRQMFLPKNPFFVAIPAAAASETSAFACEAALAAPPNVPVAASSPAQVSATWKECAAIIDSY